MAFPVLMTSLALLQVAQDAKDAKPLQPGVKAPDVNLKSMDGTEVSLKKALGAKRTILVFYRGGWCPFCNTHLAELAKSDEDFKKMGWQVVGITPDIPENIVSTTEKNKLPYQIYSDSDANALKAVGVAFKVDDGTFNTYKDEYKLDLEKWSGKTHHILPVPSLFLIDEGGTIRYTYSNPDYRERITIGTLMFELKKAGG